MNNTAIIANSEIVYLPVDSISTNPYQPRRFFDRSGLEELAKSIRLYGVIQPISVRIINGRVYELVAGERRMRASKLAGLATIPAVIVSATDKDSAVLAIIENLQRQNLNYLEEAEGFHNLISDYSFTQEELAERVGKSQSAIANKIRLLRLSKQIQKLLIENELTERHARALLKLDSEEAQIEIIQRIVKFGLSVKKTEELIDLTLSKKAEEARRRAVPRFKRYIKDMRIFTNTIRSAVETMNSAGIKANYSMEESSDSCEIKIRIEY